MEQLLPPGAGRGAHDDLTQGRDDPARNAALRALASARDGGQLPGDTVAQSNNVSAHFDSLLRFTAACASAVEPEADRLTPRDIEEFAQSVLSGGTAAGLQRIEELRVRGMRLDAIYLHLLGPAARHLGVLWEEDRCDFTQVTIGLGGLHRILRELSPQFRSGIEWTDEDVHSGGISSVNSGRRLLLVPASGEQHSLGLLMVADFFARAGWDVWGGETPAGGELFRLVRDQWFDVVGLAVGCERRLELLAADIRSLRATSRNRAVRVMVGGPVLVTHPEYAAVVGADGMAVDAWEALRVAEGLLAHLNAAQESAGSTKGGSGT